MKCRNCYIGRFQRVQIPYLTPLEGYLLVVPNASARQCDTCRRVIFNEDFLERMHFFLDRLSRGEINLEGTDWYTLSEQQENWQSFMTFLN